MKEAIGALLTDACAETIKEIKGFPVLFLEKRRMDR